MSCKWIIQPIVLQESIIVSHMLLQREWHTFVKPICEPYIACYRHHWNTTALSSLLNQLPKIQMALIIAMLITYVSGMKATKGTA